jgi:RNA polymerase sigma-70 factor (ECF subfamily)
MMSSAGAFDFCQPIFSMNPRKSSIGSPTLPEPFTRPANTRAASIGPPRLYASATREEPGPLKRAIGDRRLNLDPDFIVERGDDRVVDGRRRAGGMAMIQQREAPSQFAGASYSQINARRQAGRGGRHRMDDVLQNIEQEIPRLRRYARYLRREPDHADDLVQECLSRAIAKIDTWQPGTNLRAWLFVILRNCHINEIRREQRVVSLEDESPASEPVLSVPGSQETRVALAEVRRAFLRLSEEHREVLLLVAIEGLQYEEASAILEVPLGTVRSRLSRARQALRQALDAGLGVAGDPAKRLTEKRHG